MAARKDSRLKKQHREAIQTSMLIKRLSDHALGNVEMTATQVRAAEALIRKTLPDLKATELTGPDGGPIEYNPKPFGYLGDTAEDNTGD